MVSQAHLRGRGWGPRYPRGAVRRSSSSLTGLPPSGASAASVAGPSAASELEGGVPNLPTSLDPPLQFRSPPWFRNLQVSCPGKICWHHYEICEEVERDMRFLRRQLQPLTAEEVEEEESKIMKMKTIEYEDRNAKIAAFVKEKQEANKKRKHKKRKYQRLKRQQWKSVEVKFNPLAFKLTEYDDRIKKWTFKEGKKYEISELLSGGRRITRSSRKYLINNKGDKVDIRELSKKHVVLYFWSLPEDNGQTFYRPDQDFIATLYWPDQDFNADLEEIYFNQEKFEEKLEVVFVALGSNEDVFHEVFSRMPWLAIPHEDQRARDFFIQKFDIPHPSYERGVLFAPDGTLVVDNLEPKLFCYGASGFPFTNERIDTLVDEWEALRKELFLKKQIPPFTALLGAHIISRDGSEVPTSELDSKTVGLYFFEPTYRGFKWARKLLKVWESLNDEQRNAFVIVFINKDPYNLSIAKAEFKKKFRFSIPWYSVAVCGRKLCRVFNKQFSSIDGVLGDLIVLRPDCYQHLSYFAFHILAEFGSDAYPFTLENAVKITKSEQQNELVLGKLLSLEAPLRRGGSVCHKEDSDTTVSKLLGKRVLLLFATHSCYESGSFLVELKRMYEKKRTDDDFEIIYISLDCDESLSSFPKSVQEMPWLVHAFEAEFAIALVQQVFDVFPPRLPAIAAFGPGGHLETKESNLAFKNNCNSNSKYPFIEGNLDVEVHRELIHYYKWDLDRIIASDFSFTN